MLTRQRFERIWVPLLLSALSLFFLADLLNPPVGQYLGGEDVTGQLLQSLRLARSEILAGRLPVWSPSIAAGLPLWANPQPGLLYPPNWILLVLPFNVGLSWLAAFHLFWAGLGMYQWARINRIGSGASFVGALAFSYSGFFVVRIADGHPNFVATLAWLPWSMAAIEYSLRSPTARSAAIAGISLAMCVYAGNPAGGYLIGLLVSLWVLMEVLYPPKPVSGGWQRWGRPLRQLAIASVIAIGVSAAQLLPTLELIFNSMRGGQQGGYDFASQYSLPVAHLISILIPNFFGEPVRLGYWGESRHTEFILYPGLVTLLLAASAAKFGHGDRRIRLWLVLVFVGLLLMLGPMGGLHQLAYRFVPFLGLVRAPARFAIWSLLAVASLAAWAIDYFVHRPDLRWGTATSLILTICIPTAASIIAFLIYTLVPREDARAYHIGSGFLQAALFVGLGAALLLSRPKLASIYFVGLGALIVLSDLWGYGKSELRLISEGQATMWAEASELIDKPDTPAPPRVLPWNMYPLYLNNGMDVGLASVLAYDPLVLSDYKSFIDSVPDPRATTFDLLNTEYLLIPADQTQWQSEPSVEYLGKAADFAVYRRLNALPRVWVAAHTEAVANLSDALGIIHSHNFAPLNTALVMNSSGCPTGAGGSAQIIHFQPDVVTVATNGSGILVLSEAWYPGWRASVDGQSVPVLKVDGVLRGLCLPSGQHTVLFQFDPPLVKWGLLVTGVTMVILLASLVRSRMPRAESNA